MLREHKRISIAENCTGCFACEVACKQEHNLPVGTRWIRVLPDIREINGRLRLNYHVSECEHTGGPPCQHACPAEVNPWHYIRLISEGRFEEALHAVRAITPFVGVLGRICTRPCEGNCERGKIDVPIAIRSLKRFIADYEMRAGRERVSPVIRSREDKVAIIGSGPAGLSCAYDLNRERYPVTVFEAAPQAGGLLRYGIPEFRLPKEVVDNEISYIEDLGVQIKTNSLVKSLADVFNQGYKAIFLAVGAQASQKMGIPGEEAEGVMYALDFLKQASSGAKVSLGEKVAVIGGANSAVDAARTARHLGANEVAIIYRRSQAEMTAITAEVRKAEQEGITINFLTTPVQVLVKDKKLSGIRCVRIELGQPDATGRRRPMPVRGSEFNMHIDNLLIAIGETVDKAMLPDGLEYTNQGTLRVSPLTLETNVAGVFAGGDAITGPDDVIGAVAAGKRAAVSIDRYLRGMDLRENRSVAKRAELPKEGFEERRIANKGEAIAEANRCLNCGVCGEAIENNFQPPCVNACPAHCIYFVDAFKITPKTGTYSVA